MPGMRNPLRAYPGRSTRTSPVRLGIPFPKPLLLVSIESSGMGIKLIAAAGVLLVSPFYAAFAGSVDQLVVFGDSLSDNGNAAAALASQGKSLGNYASNALTDGPATNPPTTGPFGLWVDQFAAKTGLPDPQPFVVNTPGGLALNPTGTNFAVASAQTGHNPNFSLATVLTSQQVPWTTDQLGIYNFVSGSTASPSSLYTFWAGSDDIAHSLTTNPLNFVDAAKDAANSIEANIKMLAGEGGRYFMWFNLPPLGETPAARAFGPLGTFLANEAASAFNGQMTDDIASLQQTLSGVTIIGVDIHAAFERITDNPKAYGFTNVTDPAQGNSGVNPNTYLFWDDLHPTTAADTLIADAAAAAAGHLISPVPEPASLLLALLGIAVLIAPLRRFMWRAVLKP